MASLGLNLLKQQKSADPGAPGLLRECLLIRDGEQRGREGRESLSMETHLKTTPVAIVPPYAGYKALIERLKSEKPLPKTEPGKDNGAP